MRRLVVTAVLLAVASVTTTRPADASNGSIVGAGVVWSPDSWMDAPAFIAVEQVDGGGAVEICELGWHDCGLGAYGPGDWLVCWKTVRINGATAWYGAAVLGWPGDWFAVKIIDYGPGRIDRLGIQISETPANDGRCGAARIPTSPLIAGDFVTDR